MLDNLLFSGAFVSALVSVALAVISLLRDMHISKREKEKSVSDGAVVISKVSSPDKIRIVISAKNKEGTPVSVELNSSAEVSEQDIRIFAQEMLTNLAESEKSEYSIRMKNG